MTAVRWVLGGTGALVMAYGTLLVLTRQDPLQLLELAVWAGAGVVLHDGVVAGVVLGVAALGRRVLPAAWRAPALLALVVWGSVSLMAIPVLGRFGARPDNPTLLDRPYLAGWAVLTAAAVFVVVVSGFVRGRRVDNA